ncbi:unnamed protein product [Paramecium octaurelia]|uniref:Transmembrane protein n=1 Tax=Paramecium octaurelia TaxID=43137 RepID=A0A8S1W0H7_PAROT|nr:unnamed protein product [Paramecium octaurelia]
MIDIISSKCPNQTQFIQSTNTFIQAFTTISILYLIVFQGKILANRKILLNRGNSMFNNSFLNIKWYDIDGNRKCKQFDRQEIIFYGKKEINIIYKIQFNL